MLNYVAVVDRPDEETRHLEESLSLYRQFYDRPVALPSQVASELTSGNAASDPSTLPVPLTCISLVVLHLG